MFKKFIKKIGFVELGKIENANKQQQIQHLQL